MNGKREYTVRRSAARDIHAEMKAACREREAKKARLLVDSLDAFYAGVAGSGGMLSRGATDIYTREEYEKAHAEIMEYLQGGPMPWVQRRIPKKEREQTVRLKRLKLTLGKPVDKKPLAVERRIDLCEPHDRRETRRQLRRWRDWGTITAFVYTGAGEVFKFEGRITLAEGKYMLKSVEGSHLPLEDLLLEPEKIEQPVVELGIIFEKRGDKGPWGGYVR